MKMTKKIDKRKNYYLVLDTETCPIDRTIEKVEPKNMLVYDIGFRVVDKNNNCYYEGSYIVSEIFFGEFDTKMKSSYYANKIPMYLQDIANDTRKVRTWEQISFALRKVIETYEIDVICCHNARFDFGSIKNTEKYLDTRPLLPYLTWWDTLKIAKSVLGKMPSYIKFCKDNNFMTKHKNPQPQYKAEVIYKYITKNLDFIESHTGLEDTRIESVILSYCFKQHKPMEKLLFA